MRVVIVSNPSSGSAGSEVVDEIAATLGRAGDVERVEPESPELFDVELKAAAGEATHVVVAGGDGTMNLSVNALADRLDDVTFALVPMGTGNDLARTLDLPLEPSEAARAIVDGRETSIDVSAASSSSAERLFVNACLGGFPVEVDEAIDPALKKRLGPLAFIVGGLKAAGDLERFLVKLNDVEVPDCLAVGVGNGRTSGGGITVWPHADPGDGALDGCALPAAGVAGAARLAAKVKLGSHSDIADVKFERAPRIVIKADPPIELNVDGELIGLETPATFEVVGRIRMLVPAAKE
jgi:diacylglycerol kinase (ATP)